MRSTARFLAVLSVAFACSAHGDDIILKGGQVIEGKILQSQTNAANKGKTNPNDIVLVIQTDEEGKTRTVARREVQYIVSKKPSWVKRLEAKAWYEKYSPKVKDTRSQQESFGRKCKAKGLDEEAAKHYKRALEFLRADLDRKKRIKLRDYEKIAKWCRKAGLLDEEKAEFDRIIVWMQKKAMGSEDPVAGLVDVAEWVRTRGMKKRSMELFNDILKDHPDHEGALAGIGSIKESAEYQMQHILNDYIQAKKAWKIKVTIEDNASAKQMEEWEAKLKELSDFIWEVTQGQFFVYEWILEDQASNGQVIVEKGKLEWGGRNGKGSSGVLATCYRLGTPNWYIRCPGKVWTNVLVHEMFHGIFGLLDEYYQNPQCPCVMRSAPSPQRLCTSATHKGGGRQKGPCVDSIKKRHSEFVYPNPAWTTTDDAVKGARNRGTTVEIDGYLKRGEAQISGAPVCKVIVIDK